MFKNYFDRNWDRGADSDWRPQQEAHERWRREVEQQSNVGWKQHMEEKEWDRMRERDHERIAAEKPWRWENQGVQPSSGTFGGAQYGGVMGTSAYGGGAEAYSITNPDANEWLAQKQGKHRGVGPAGYKRSDSRVTEDICERLTDHPHIDARNIEVDVKDGEVTLTGTVPDRRTRLLAEEAADTVSGVKDINNQIRVSRENLRERGDDAA